MTCPLSDLGEMLAEIVRLDRQRAGNEEQVSFIIDELRDVKSLYMA